MRILALGIVVFLVACQQMPQEKDKALESSALKKNYAEVEKENLELKLRNDILLKALRTPKSTSRKISSTREPSSQINAQEPFPQFNQLMYEQAQMAYEKKDMERLIEIVRMYKSNSPSSSHLPQIYIWLSTLQTENGKLSQALFTLNEFSQKYPKHKSLPRVLYSKGKIYEKLDLKIQAQGVYQDIQRTYPKSEERVLADKALRGIRL